ncbi:hypothetical protein I545_5672 [Mycobacterium kansasii 662]|uniref:Uncharacterized protein n=1 Tax=Mycobacterium kansasii 662 TaxID=1299326 RepID=X7YU79_MYCKA|nr:hypothetical protein I547_6876 [Mycobacterium kansasii 824]EUA10296.1 hypothetical protein I545_5672 [Mycobacterium kansasii 662]KEP41012.1 hypothetical protein MKSMC1_38480 [Mycobacterium kansasii]
MTSARTTHHKPRPVPGPPAGIGPAVCGDVACCMPSSMRQIAAWPPLQMRGCGQIHALSSGYAAAGSFPLPAPSGYNSPSAEVPGSCREGCRARTWHRAISTLTGPRRPTSRPTMSIRLHRIRRRGRPGPRAASGWWRRS